MQAQALRNVDLPHTIAVPLDCKRNLRLADPRMPYPDAALAQQLNDGAASQSVPLG